MRDIPENDGWLDGATAERLLRGEGAGDAGPHAVPLERLLAAAAEPLECAPEGEQAALQAFRRARAAASVRERPGRAPVWPERSRRSIKLLLGGVAALFAVSGVAIAAQTGALPHPFGSGGTPRHGSPHHPGRAPGTHGGPGTVPTAMPTARSSAQAGGPPRTGVRQLCESHAWAAGHGRGMPPSAEARLARAAGGAARIGSYCASVLARPAAGHSGTPAAPEEPPGQASPKASKTTKASKSPRPPKSAKSAKSSKTAKPARSARSVQGDGPGTKAVRSRGNPAAAAGKAPRTRAGTPPPAGPAAHPLGSTHHQRTTRAR
jgi:hypothetical protein